MRRPTTEEQEGLRALLARAYKPGDTMTGLELLGEAWLDDVLQTAGVDKLVEVTADVDGTWCSDGCPGNSGRGYCLWYDYFDVPDDGSPGAPDVLHLDGPAAPELCPFRQPGRAVLVRALP